jgi:hypothetical protein
MKIDGPVCISLLKSYLVVQGEHSCHWMKDKSGGKSLATLYMQAGMCKTKGSLATVCSTACNEKTTKRLGNSLSGGTAKKAKS